MAHLLYLVVLQLFSTASSADNSTCVDHGLPEYFQSCASWNAPFLCCDARHETALQDMCHDPAGMPCRSTSDGKFTSVSTTPLNEWPMLMTHDTGSGYLTDLKSKVYAWTRTQPASDRAFTKQLDCGARAFDLRAHVNGKGSLVFHHGIIKVNHWATSALNELVTWANAHPSLEDLVVIYNWDCSGPNCSSMMMEAFADLGIGVVTDCSILENLTVGAAASRSALSGGGHVLVLQDCVDMNYDPALTCSGFDRSEGLTASDSTVTLGQDRCTHLPDNSTFEEQYACGLELREQLGGHRVSEENIFGYYHCWEGAAGKDFAVNRLLNNLTAVAARVPKPGRLQEIQALWQESVKSTAIGIALSSSLLIDEEKSGLNALMVQKIDAGVFKHISFFEVNNVCDHGPELLQALRRHHSRKMLTNRAAGRTEATAIVV